MGAKSTIGITRSQALAFVMNVLYQASNETLSRVVEELNDGLWENGDYENSLGLHNFQIKGEWE
jgi:hypothetical protein